MASDYDYKKANYDQILIRVKKGKQADYREAAAALGLGQMELFRQAVDEFIARHSPNTGEEDSGGADETAAESIGTNEKSAGGEGIPVINSERTTAAQNQPVSNNVQSIQATAENAPQRITAADRDILAAVDTLSPESKETLLKFLRTLQG